MIAKNERKKMMQSYAIGPKMVDYLNQIGINKRTKLAKADPREISERIHQVIGDPNISEKQVESLGTLIDLAIHRDRHTGKKR
ncbi:MAG: hypothetical protein ABJN26_19735 [Stappiaceae bacterium]